ncbi:Imm10 family immunity protein [Streptomyces tendae]|uniref:Imm10 family immunity protein n=1 Tax=Streptomyces tendae TaxID=1932 RepID=UPI0033DB94CB
MEIVTQSVGFEVDEEDEVREAGFSEGTDEPGFTLLIQQSDYESDEQDISLAFDTYYLVSGGRSHYGGLRRVERDTEMIRFLSTSQAATAPGISESLTVRFEAPTQSMEAYSSGLPGIRDWDRETERPILVGS